MTKTELKMQAQEALLYYMGAAFYALNDGSSDVNEQDREAYRKILNREYKRVQRLFGFEQTGFSS